MDLNPLGREKRAAARDAETRRQYEDRQRAAEAERDRKVAAGEIRTRVIAATGETTYFDPEQYERSMRRIYIEPHRYTDSPEPLSEAEHYDPFLVELRRFGVEYWEFLDGEKRGSALWDDGEDFGTAPSSAIPVPILKRAFDLGLIDPEHLQAGIDTARERLAKQQAAIGPALASIETIAAELATPAAGDDGPAQGLVC